LDYQRTIMMTDGRERTYRLHEPGRYQPENQYPLMFAFHGGGGDGRKMERLTGFSDLADQHNFLVAYPNGVEGYWNDGRGTTPAELQGVDDIAFFDALLFDISTFMNLDFKRVYAVGMSNGGIFTHRLSWQRSKTLAGSATVAGLMAASLDWDSMRPLSLSSIGFHGTHDPVVPYRGGEVKGQYGGEVLAASRTLGNWFMANRCLLPEKLVPISDSDPNDGCTVTWISRSDCHADSKVEFYIIANGGHTWPGSTTRDYPPESGNLCMDINASEEICRFFRLWPGAPSPAPG
jgi:polyhydroxybutyrate depolymerase